MSNLWFFRLKRAEQQRRRSSGEQSVGSASVQSAAGCCSSLPLADPAPPTHTVATSGATTSASGVAEQRARYGGLRTSEDDLEQDDQDDEHYYGRGHSSMIAPAEVAQELPVIMTTTSYLHEEDDNNQQQSSANTSELPPVTIIRSDSTSTSFLAMGRHHFGEPPSTGSGVAQESSRREVVSELLSASSRSPQLIETRVAPLASPGHWQEIVPPGGRAGSGGEQAPTSNEQEQRKDSTSSTLTNRSRFLIHDHLNSGKVPPIHQARRKLLTTTGSGRPSKGSCSSASGLQLTDSLDNLASLIPRIRVEFYNSDDTLKEKLQLYLIKDHTVSLYVRTAKLILKILACYLYAIRVILDRGPAHANCYGCQSSAQANNVTFGLPSVVAQQADLLPSANPPQMFVHQQQQQQSLSKFDGHPYEGPINFRALFWVDRGAIIWALQTTIAVICFIEALLMQYLTYKNNIFPIISFHFMLEIITNLPFILSIFCKELRTLFVAGFLNCWLAKQCLEATLNDISIVRQTSVFSHRLTILSTTVFCLIFTTACGFQHSQRGGGRNISLFEGFYFVVVTFSTVGYGDIKPETWPAQSFIMAMICVALIVLPTQFEKLVYFWFELKKLGASYAHHSTSHEKHVVVCSTTLRADTIMDFLNEFYAHPLLQTFSVVLLSPCELDTTMKLVLQTPTWNNRVVYIQGSALKANDLIRARMQSAEACFILAARNYLDRSAADEHTILRSWAIRDFSPYVPQYVQIFRTENKIHVAFAEHVVCDEEFKYALLANNCLIPGTSTLVTLLLHTSQQQRHHHHHQAKRRRRRRGNLATRTVRQLHACCTNLITHLGRPFGGGRGRQSDDDDDDDATDWRSKINNAGGRIEDERKPTGETGKGGNGGATTNEQDEYESDDSEHDPSVPEWKRLYGKCSANEIYHIRLSDSRFFGEYQGKSFTYASFHSHRKFGVALVGVQTDMRGAWPIMLNPGPTYVLKPSDILFYINITKEENSALMPMMAQQSGPTSGVVPPTQSPEVSVRAAAAEEEAAAGAAAEVMAPTSTYILIESSSPTRMGGTGPDAPPPEEDTPTREEPTRSRQQMVERHSVADGASIVARSLCSVAGLPGAGLIELLPTAIDDATARRFHSSAKRNSSASTSGALIAGGGRGGSRNASTLELSSHLTATNAGDCAGGVGGAAGSRKGSNISITSTRSRDGSATRLKQVVSGLAVKMKRVKLGKSLTHLTIPRMDLGGGSSNSSTESFVNARGRRPSIAPVPAMMGESEEHDSDHEREQESYFSMSWQSSSEQSPIVKKFVFCTTYVGVSPTLCYLLQRKKSPCCLQLIQACEHCPYKNARQYNWPNRCVILASDFASNGIYNFLVPLRAHFHNPNELRPIVLLLERKPSPQFIDAISWFPMVYWMPGSIDSLDDLIKAGINLANSVVVTNKEATNSAEEDYLADCNTIVAVQTMFKMFPSVGIITELSQSSNMRFMQFRAHDLLLGGLTLANFHQHNQQQVRRQTGGSGELGVAGDSADRNSLTSAAGSNIVRDRIQLRKIHSQYFNKTASNSNSTSGRSGDINSHAYKYRLPFAAGNVFSASMLDTLLYQAFVKDYMITMVRLLLGIDQAPGSGFLSSMRITKDELWIRTYGRLYQRLCSTTCEIPLGIYRTEPLERNSTGGALKPSSLTFGAFVSQQASYEQATEELERIEISNMVKNRLQDLGMNVADYDDSITNRNNTFSYVIINPNCDVPLREGDIIYLIRPSPIHSRKLFMHRANSVRYVDQPTAGEPNKHHHQAPPPPPPQQPPTHQWSQMPTSGVKQTQPEVATATTPTSQQQQQHQHAECTLKSYFSDGDFSEVLIKINDHDDQQRASQQQQQQFNDEQSVKRRRSSCSDAGDSKRSSLSHEQ